MTRDRNYLKEKQSLVRHTTSPNEGCTWTGSQSWEPDRSPQVMAVITTFIKPMKNKD
jgi:hypothetical protein